MTRNKKLILDVLKKEDLPLNASQVHENCNFAPDLATVYRNLQSLEKDGYAESFVFECKDRGIERYYTVKNASHVHYLHCERCHKFIPVDLCPMENFYHLIENEYDFSIHQHFFSIKGLCKDCRGQSPE